MTGSDRVIFYMIIGLGIIAGCAVFSAQIKQLVRIAAKGGIGLAVIYFINSLGLGFSVGVNIVNGILIGVFGLPALIGLYIINCFIK